MLTCTGPVIADVDAGPVPWGQSPFRISRLARSVLVPVAVVTGVPMPVVHVVDMVAVRHGDMAAPFTVHMIMR